MQIKIEDRALIESEKAKPSSDAAWWAKKSCKHCYGRGVVGKITIKVGSNSIINSQLCHCAKKNFMQWRDEWIEDWKKKQANMSIPESTANIDKVS